MEARTQTRYERSFRAELSKLESCMSTDREKRAALEAQHAAALRAERDRKAYEAEKTKRLQAMEQAIVFAEKQTLKAFGKTVC